MSKRKTCKKYKSCKHVPCGEMMNKCTPSYCSTGSKNWGLCNMANWGGPYKKLRSNCKSEKKCRLVNNKITNDQVPMEVLETKMPFIWRHLDGKTRKKMVKLARKNTVELNIDRMKK